MITISEYNEGKLIDEFLKIPYDLTRKEYSTSQLFSYKNNFWNILASDETRVKLKKSSSDYINANYILDNYIATQHPNKESLNDFWLMVYESKSTLIINLNESNNYLPPNQSNIYGNIHVKITNCIDKKYIQLRTLELHENNHCKKVYHITFLSWPDKSIPDKDEFNKFMNIIKILNVDFMIVHCKAGIGRTGTFILIDYMLRMIKNNKKNINDIISTVREMRAGRYGMIQSSKQFKFALSYIICQLSIMNKENFKYNRKLSSSCNDISKKDQVIITNKSKLHYSTEISIR